jgi:hypothetical protein
VRGEEYPMATPCDSEAVSEKIFAYMYKYKY